MNSPNRLVPAATLKVRFDLTNVAMCFDIKYGLYLGAVYDHSTRGVSSHGAILIFDQKRVFLLKNKDLEMCQRS